MIHFHQQWPSWFARCGHWVLALLAVTVFGALQVALWLAVAEGGCNIPPPSDPLTGRRDDICAALHRQPECELRVRRTIGGHVEATETDFLLYVGGRYLGQFPIVDGLRVDPADLNTELVRRALLYRMGDGEVQARVRQAIGGRVSWVDAVNDWTLGRADVVIAVW